MALAGILRALPKARTLANGRTEYRNAQGRFISRRQYLRERRRGADGRFLSKKAFSGSLTDAEIAQELEASVGPPIGGGRWIARVQQSRERFEQIITKE